MKLSEVQYLIVLGQFAYGYLSVAEQVVKSNKDMSANRIILQDCIQTVDISNQSILQSKATRRTCISTDSKRQICNL